MAKHDTESPELETAEPGAPQANPLERQNRELDETGTGGVWFKYRNWIYGGLVAVLVVVAGIFWYTEEQQETRERAKAATPGAFRAMEVDSVDVALKGKPGKPGLNAILDEFGGTPHGNLARYMAGVAYLSKGQPAQALEHLEEYDPKDDLVSSSALAAKASALEEQNDLEGAAEAWKAAAGQCQNAVSSPYYLDHQARCLRLAGLKVEALDVYTNLRKTYPLSQQGQSAEKYIVLLGGSIED